MKTVSEPFNDDLASGLVHASSVIKNVYYERAQLYMALIKLMLEMEVDSFPIDLQTDGQIISANYSVEFVPDLINKSVGKVVLVRHSTADANTDGEL